jgi:hypothetical protein
MNYGFFRLIYDLEFDDNLDKTMYDLMLFHDTVLTISDEDQPLTVTLILSQWYVYRTFGPVKTWVLMYLNIFCRV